MNGRGIILTLGQYTFVYLFKYNIMKKTGLQNARKVLIVDDEEEIGLLMKRILRNKFAVIEHALTLKEGLSFAGILKPNIILLDNNLPDGSGIERLEEFRTAAPDTCIIVVSAMTHLGKTALENGAFAFIEKPLSFNRIMETIDQACTEK